MATVNEDSRSMVIGVVRNGTDTAGLTFIFHDGFMKFYLVISEGKIIFELKCGFGSNEAHQNKIINLSLLIQSSKYWFFSVFSQKD